MFEISAMSEKYLYQFNVKLSYTLRDELVNLAKEQGVKPSELVRNWIREKLLEARKHPGRPRLVKGEEGVTA